eukprot:500433_1
MSSSHPSHIENVHAMIEQLEIHKVNIQSPKAINIQQSGHLQCGDIEATRKIFDQLTVLTDASQIHIWPLPQSYTLFEDIVSINVLDFEYESNVDHPIITKGIERYKAIMFPHQTKRQYSSAESPDTINKLIIYVLDNAEDDGLDMGFDEEYELIIHDPAHEHSCNEIILRSNKIYGALRGLETLSQLIHYNFYTDEYETNIGIVKDYPRYPHRGVLLDTSRHFHPVVALKRFLLSLSFVKYNVFHWHVVDEESFPYESKVFPNLWNGSYSAYERYSEADIIEVIAYATDLGIRVIPEFDTPGHAGSWCKGYPELCIKARCRDPSPHLLDPSKEFTWTLIDGFFKEASQRFGDSFFHLGSDEVIHDCYLKDGAVQQFVKKEGITGTKGVYKYFVQHTHKIAKKYGKRAIVWNEVYDNFGHELDKDLVIQLWQGGERTKRQRMIDEGFSVIVSYGWYLDHVMNKWEDMYQEDPRAGLQGNNIDKVIGGETCMWSEKIDLSNLFATVWPKGATPAERLWSHQDVRDIKSAKKRYQWLRCLFIRRGIGASPTIKQQSRQEPPIQNSCLVQ